LRCCADTLQIHMIAMTYTVEGVRRQICEVLSLSACPLKAKQISKVLSPHSPDLSNKHYVNSILYELKKYGIVSCDHEFRWSICPAAIEADSASTEFVPTVDPEEKKRIRDLGPRPISSLVGHWVFTLGREPASGREVWRIECALCGFQTGCRVQNHQQVFPLSGELRARRRKHDKAVHPEKAKNQILIEKSLLGENVEPQHG
jgi:hypothetical protein